MQSVLHRSASCSSLEGKGKLNREGGNQIRNNDRIALLSVYNIPGREIKLGMHHSSTHDSLLNLQIVLMDSPVTKAGHGNRTIHSTVGVSAYLGDFPIVQENNSLQMDH